MIPAADVERLRNAVDILDVVRRYVPNLRRSGKEYFGLCPFHNERTPSFTVNPVKGAFFCRGCQKSGDVVGFVMAAESLSFPQAVRLLAEQAGITIGEQRRTGEDVYVAQLAAEAAWFWREVRLRYAVRQARAVAYRNMAKMAADAESDEGKWWANMAIYRRYARSAARWDRIITRLDGRTKGELLTRYIGIRQRHPAVANAYRADRELIAACEGIEKKAAAWVATAPVTRFFELMRTITTHFAG